jgi:nucleoside-diphosphate-sugar epimerase
MRRIAEEDLKDILQHTEPLWQKIRDKSIFLTGGTGFFGKWLLESFIYINEVLRLNASITVLTRNPDKFLQDYPFYTFYKNVSFLKGDVLNFKFPNEKYQFVIHAATEADAKLNTENPLLMLDTITKGTRRVLDFAKEQPIESFLLTSSGAVYGKQPSSITHIKESDGFFIDINNPNSSYAEGKRLAELYCAIYYQQFGVPVKIARCFAFVGPYLPLDKHFAIGNFILNGLNKEDFLIKGDGTPFRSYLYAADLAIWLWTILFNGENNTPYNVGSDYSLSIKETAEVISKAFNKKTTIQIAGKSSGKPVQRYVPAINFIKNKLRLSVNTNLEKSILNTIHFYK